MKTRTTTIAGLVAALTIPCTAATAATKTDRAQNKLIKKLTHDLKVVSAREKRDQNDFISLISCISTYDLTWYGDTLGTNTDGYTYVGTDGVPFQFTAMAPTYPGDVPNGSFLVLDCTQGRANKQRFLKSRMFTETAHGKAVAPHRH